MDRWAPDPGQNNHYRHVRALEDLRTRVVGSQAPMLALQREGVQLTGRNFAEQQEDAHQLYGKLKRMRRIEDLEAFIQKVSCLDARRRQAHRRGINAVFGEFAYSTECDNAPGYDIGIIFGLEDKDSLVYTIVEKRHPLLQEAYLEERRKLYAAGIRDIAYDGRFDR